MGRQTDRPQATDAAALWARYKKYVCHAPTIGLELDISRMGFDDAYLDRMAKPMAAALGAMAELESGKAANVDEDRRVGHYWLRAPALAPEPAAGKEIEEAVRSVKRFAGEIHGGAVRPERGDAFYILLVLGVGGSALGPQLLVDALGTSDDPILVRFLDNTDPDGIRRTLAELDESLAQTLTLVVSKSGGTKETRNTMLEVADAYKRYGLSFARHAAAVTCRGSELHNQAQSEGWLRTFPLWEWVGGRTSVTSCVGLLPAALLGADIDAFLSGAAEADVVTRGADVLKNPAALLALMWHYAGEGVGARNMVVMPYRDRLGLFGRHLQQLVMESIGKGRDREGREVLQGLTVFGNKGSTDQHAYVQQLREGRDDFFVTFINTRRDGDSKSLHVEESVTTGDYLDAFRLGTRAALTANGRESLTITLDELTAHRMGALIALFERAVGLYAELINVNAYDQPGVEAGKKAAAAVLDLQRRILTHLRTRIGEPQTVEAAAAAVGEPAEAETIYHILAHIAANPDHGVDRADGDSPGDARFLAR